MDPRNPFKGQNRFKLRKTFFLGAIMAIGIPGNPAPVPISTTISLTKGIVEIEL